MLGSIVHGCDEPGRTTPGGPAAHVPKPPPAPPHRPPASHTVTDQRCYSPGERSSHRADLRRSTAVHARRRVAADRRPPLVAERALPPTGDLAAVLRARPQLETSLPQLRWNRGVFDAHPRSGSVAIRTSPAGPTPEKAGRRRPTPREEPPRSSRRRDRGSRRWRSARHPARSPHLPCPAVRCRCRTWATARTMDSRPGTRSR